MLELSSRTISAAARFRPPPVFPQGVVELDTPELKKPFSRLFFG
jgi:hypothetical protein